MSDDRERSRSRSRSRSRDRDHDRDRSRSRSPRRDRDGDRDRHEDGRAASSAHAPSSTAAASSSGTQAGDARPRIHISNIPSHWTNDDARKVFEPFGTITDVIVFKDPMGRARYGFIEFDRDSDAEAARREVQGKMFDGMSMVINEAKPKMPQGGEAGTKRLYVCHIGKGVTEGEIRDEFSKYGPLTECSMWFNTKSGPNPIVSAFVEYERAEDARAAREAMHGKPILRSEEERKAEEEGRDFIPAPLLVVDFAKPPPPRPNRGFGGGYGRGVGVGGYSSGYGAGYGSRYRDDRYNGARDYRDRDRERDYRRDDYYRSSASASSSSRGYGYDRDRGYERDRDYRSSSSRGYERDRDYRDRDRDRAYERYERRSRSRSPRRHSRDRSRSPRRR